MKYYRVVISDKVGGEERFFKTNKDNFMFLLAAQLLSEMELSIQEMTPQEIAGTENDPGWERI